MLSALLAFGLTLGGCANITSAPPASSALAKGAKSTRAAKDAKRQEESVCGSTIDWFEAEDFKGSKPVSQAVVQRAGRRTVRIVLKQADAMRQLITKMYPGTKPEDIEFNKYQQYAGEGWCTGTLLNRSTVITAAHCFQPGANSPSVYVDNLPVQLTADQLAVLFEVQAGYQFAAGTKMRQQGSRSAVQKLREFGPKRPGELDYAILTIAPFESVGGRMAINTAELPQQSAVAIVHHPLGLPKKVSIGTLDSYSESGIFYSHADTEFASSGAGVLDQNGKLIGIHTEGGCEKYGNNVGVAISAIASASQLLRKQ